MNGRPDAAEAISELIGERGAGLTICPSEAARRVDPDAWRAAMPDVHAAARGLVKRGEIVLTQGGVVVAPDAIVGAYRIRKA